MHNFVPVVSQELKNKEYPDNFNEKLVFESLIFVL